PEFRDDKNFFALDLSLLEHLLNRFADLSFSSVAFRSVDCAKSCFQRRLRRVFGCHWVGNQCAKSERGDRTGSVVKRHLRIGKVAGCCHCVPPAMSPKLVSAGFVLWFYFGGANALQRPKRGGLRRVARGRRAGSGR